MTSTSTSTSTSQEFLRQDGLLLPLFSFITKTHHDTYPAIDPTRHVAGAADAKGRSVVITGASKGFGRAAATAFARAGYSRIAIGARSFLSDDDSAKKEIIEKEIRDAAREAGRSDLEVVLVVGVDVADEGSVEGFVAKVDEAFDGVVDVLVNNAGTSDPWLPFAETKTAEWRKTWEVNVHGVYLCARYFLPLVLKSPLKTILNISSASSQCTSFGASGYQTSKFAVSRLTEFLVMDYYDQGLIAIALHPGGVPTEITGPMSGLDAWLIDTLELGADFMVWLCRERRDWLKGRFVVANWDVDELLAKREKLETNFDLLKFRLVL